MSHSSFCLAYFFQLPQLWQVRSSPTTDITKMLVHAFISSSLDYCKSLLYNVDDGFKLFRMPQPVSRQRPGNLTTSYLSCVNPTGFQFISASCTRWQLRSTNVCTQWRLDIWQLMTPPVCCDRLPRYHWNEH